MNSILLVANLLVFLTFIVHTFGGDIEYRNIEPKPKSPTRLRIFWTMGRGAFHIVSIDFLFATIGLLIINFTDWVQDPNLLLTILSLYFLGYGIAFFFTLVISKKFKNCFFVMWQWILMLVNSALIYFGMV